jgi:hypothetical protein
MRVQWTAMPKTSVNEYSNLALYEHNICPAIQGRQRFPVDPVTQAGSV